MTTAAIIGTRNPDDNQILSATELSHALLHSGWEIHTGAAFGIDQAAMNAANPLGGAGLTVYLPWATYNREFIPKDAKIVVYDPVRDAEWTESVVKYHPAALRLTRGAFALHARNYGIIMGPPQCDIVIAFPNRDKGGGTAQGMRIAESKSIPLLTYPTGLCPSTFSIIKTINRIPSLFKHVVRDPAG